jgi:outer membrane protein assembly factor BamB
MAAPGDWPTPRQNRHLTAIQPMPGRMRAAPEVVARLDLGRQQGTLTPFASKPGGSVDRVAAIGDGRLRCYRLDGKLVWDAHPRGLNFERVVTAEDLDGDGRVELALTTGRPQSPLGAAVLVAADTGKVTFRYDVEPQSYWWTLQVDRFLPDSPSKAMVVCVHGYPPDTKNGYIALFDWPRRGGKPRQRWRTDFDQYTCFPTLLTADVDGDGAREICVQTHSRMWVLDARTGSVKQFLGWDVAPANVRSYGVVRFQDLNGDGRDDFFCIATFAQHHEVLLNENGRLKLAWAHGWDDSVTTSKIATVYPEPPIADVDGDGRLEMVVSMFQSAGEPRWTVRVYDAVTGKLKATALDRIAVDLADVDGDGAMEILADVSRDPTRAKIDAACLLKWRGERLEELWQADSAMGRRNEGTPEAMLVDVGGRTRRLAWDAATGVTLVDPSPRPAPAGPDLSRIPAGVGASIQAPLAADLDGDGVNEVLLYHQGRVRVYRYERGKDLVETASYASDGAPAVADLDGDGRLELIVGRASASTETVIQAIRVGRPDRVKWEVTLPRAKREGLPHGRALYFQTGRFLGRRGDDLYVYVGTPVVRSMLLDGRNGEIVWEKGEASGTERYFAPTVSLAAVHDVNGDGRDDLVFTNPDYYCVASGPTGEALVGPIIPQKIFDQPSQGLYTMPVVLTHDPRPTTLDRRRDARRQTPGASNAGAQDPAPGARNPEPIICLIDGHYFVGVMSDRAKPLWHRLPEVGVARTGAEGFVRLPGGEWVMGFGRQDGRFACVEVATGKVRWELPLDASASGVSACDIDGDGRQEFLFGTSHGDLYAVGDQDGKPRVLWKVRLPASVGTPVVADVDGDGAVEVIVATGDGRLCVLTTNGR